MSALALLDRTLADTADPSSWDRVHARVVGSYQAGAFAKRESVETYIRQMLSPRNFKGNAATESGNRWEPMLLAWAGAEPNSLLIHHPDEKQFGATVDGTRGPRIVETKAKHNQVVTGPTPREIRQVAWQLFCLPEYEGADFTWGELVRAFGPEGWRLRRDPNPPLRPRPPTNCGRTRPHRAYRARSTRRRERRTPRKDPLLMSTSVVAYESASLDARMKYANTIAAAGQMIPRGLFDPATGKPSAPKVLLVMETGSMLGLHPMAALQSINVVEGRATLAAQLMAGLIRQAGHRLEIVKSGSIPGGDYAVTVTGTRADTGDVYTSTWDIPRAIRAQLVDSYEPTSQGVYVVRARSDKGKVLPWEAYAESMPKWRAISEVALEGFSDVTLGMRSYEEMTDGGIPMSEPELEASEDWAALFKNAASRAELDAIAERLAEKGEGTDKLRAAFLARAGVLSREANTVDADVVNDDPETPAEDAATAPAQAVEPDPESAPDAPAASSAGMAEADYEAAEAARFDAAVAAGEVER